MLAAYPHSSSSSSAAAATSSSAAAAGERFGGLAGASETASDPKTSGLLTPVSPQKASISSRLIKHIMSLLEECSPHRRPSYDYTGLSSNRRPSLKEMPSFRDEACKALNRREDLQRLKERLSFNREMLHDADPASKPWLRKAAVPIREEEAARRTPRGYSLHTATPATVVPSSSSPSSSSSTLEVSGSSSRTRNLSRGTSASGDSSEGSAFELQGAYEY